MSRYQDNTAVQYERFPAQQNPGEKQLEVLPKKKIRGKAAVVPYGKYTMILCCVFVVLIGIVASYMQLATVNLQNAKLRQDISAMAGEINALNAKKEQMYNLTYVEDYAKNQLGMVKMDKSQVNYLEMDAGDQMMVADVAANSEMIQAGGGFLSRLTQGLGRVLEYLN